MKFEDFEIMDVGIKIQLAGAVFSGNGKNHIMYFPHEREEDFEDVVVDMSLEDWQNYLKQTDIMETKILAKDENGRIAKIVYRKTQRQIDQRVSWRVFKRDEYKCRYCGNDDVPLTVDHIVLWEEGGPSTVENLVSACKKCNKTRGNMQYKDWLGSKYYFKVSKNVSSDILIKNVELTYIIDDIERTVHKRSR